jgi:hypothetical protein
MDRFAIAGRTGVRTGVSREDQEAAVKKYREVQLQSDANSTKCVSTSKYPHFGGSMLTSHLVL